MLDFSEEQLDVETQKNHEITVRFYVPMTLQAPWIGALILR